MVWREGMPGNRILEERELFSDILHEKPVSRNYIVWVNNKTFSSVALEIHSRFLSSGVHQSNLFRTLPTRSRLLELINIFDSSQQPPGGFIRSRHSLPPKYPVKSGYMHSPVNLSLGSTRTHSPPSTFLSDMGLSSYTNPRESTRILVAQLVLHLLPSPHFSLLVYILAFFSQVAMVHEENGTTKPFCYDGCSRAEDARRGYDVLVFETIWGPILEGLFDVIEDAKTGALQDQQDMRRSIEKLSRRYSISIPLGHSLSNGEAPNNLSGRDTPFRPISQEEVSRSGVQSPLQVRLDPKTSDGVEDFESDSDKSLNYAPPAGRSLDNETFDIPIRSVIDRECVCTATALDERLLDVSMPTLLHQTFPIGPSNDDDDESRSVLSTSIARTTTDEIDKAHQCILVLEPELEKSNKAAAESLQELSK
ncbi:hypothetical protein BYT27DRAFT_7261933 [Phlegmacium glaucopus]|nr:hypothetical protein BYT27DRAFT_7261933 [Phlegmacium glaucopus]